ncbi:3-methyl-2-oxobutanoate hydroxymethyltransferase [Aureibacillus halotolerans]|uniref:3-methyl-2-oxobutanoate hydroxymethyltransferase n=1 Tax=Aureibacillus halotolerans TaxID=1508390 RepID=A0A4R6U751_9BACI|nr:3-methyl-2-oxobutanoate hydroxymethyltransferase [Aureibacillus halotolerans]TDQ41502.1 ketopantoate hydroxymethyltransferase [Aureibacillus halotolerans]
MKTFRQMQKKKTNAEPIVMLTAYDYPSARLAEEAGVDIILVGDSLGMVVLGYESTVPVTVDDMIHHAKAVKRGAPETLIVVDMPFMSYHGSHEETNRHARQIMQQTGAHAVKLEGGAEISTTVRALVSAGVPVVGHLGLTPQSVGVLGGYRVQGKTAVEAKTLLEDAHALEDAGACAVVVECVPAEVAEVLAKDLEVPVIGIGAGKATDGQVLVYHDVLSYSPHSAPSFVKSYDNSYERMGDALQVYVNETRSRQFPEHTFSMPEEEKKAWQQS